jgi:hypothetical protein
LLDASTEDKQVKAAYKEMSADPKVQQLVDDIQNWEITLLKRHNDAGLPLHKLCFLADIGLTIEDQRIRKLTKIIMRHQSEEGPFQVLCNFPTVFGGSGNDEWLWCLCDAPLILYALYKSGLHDDAEVNNGLDYLASLVRENGWPCKATKELGKFKGPGKASDPCPYTNLIMVRTLALRNNKDDQEKMSIGVQTLLHLWENSLEESPFLFKMGTDFRKLKVPFVWYDILHVADVISQIPHYHNDKRFQEMLSVLQSKADDDGKFTSESVWRKWKGWEFCQKREPSRWVTLCALRIFKRAGINS